MSISTIGCISLEKYYRMLLLRLVSTVEVLTFNIDDGFSWKENNSFKQVI